MAQTEFERGALWGMNYMQRRILFDVAAISPDTVPIPQQEKEAKK